MKREPVSFSTRGGSLFGWLHLPDNVTQKDCVVVICAPLGHEYTHSHRTLRHLADHLAGEGFAALRFDYHGTGDSPGNDLDPERVAQWIEDIRAARRFALSATGCSRVCLLGLRLGATLAAEALTSGEAAADGLVVWSPVVSGRRYVREARALAAAAVGGASSHDKALIEAGGFLMTEETAGALLKLDLLQSRPKVRSGCLILQRDDLEADSSLRARLESLEIATDEKSFEGYLEMMAEPQFTRVPEQALAAITQWLSQRMASLASTPRSPSEVSEPSKLALPEIELAFQDAEGRTALIQERAYRFGKDAGLFGILSQPAQSLSSNTGKPIVVLFNSGSVHRVGPNRLYVTLARSLAIDGHSCLRMDLRGLGDSSPQPAGTLQRENHPYPDSALTDAAETLAFLRDDLGHKRFIVMGLCSGAHTAFHAGVGLRDFTIADTVLINPLTYRWEEGMTLETTKTHHFQSVSYYKQSMRDPAKWLKVLRGTANFGRAWKILVAQARVVAQALLTFKETQVSKDLSSLFAQKRRLTLIIARQEPGHDLLIADGKHSLNRGIRNGLFKLVVVENADHTFSALSPRMEVIRQLRNLLAP